MHFKLSPLRKLNPVCVLIGIGSAITGPARALAQWVVFEEQTAIRMPTTDGLNDHTVTTDDPDEKDYAWGDFDQDGDVDVVVVRKQPWSTPGRRRNVLFMNEGITEGHSINGVLIDRSAEYASAADIGAPTECSNSRKVVFRARVIEVATSAVRMGPDWHAQHRSTDDDHRSCSSPHG